MSHAVSCCSSLAVQVRKYPEIKKLLLDSDGKVFMDELLREELIDQPKELRRSDSYVIGDNGL